MDGRMKKRTQPTEKKTEKNNKEKATQRGRGDNREAGR